MQSVDRAISILQVLARLGVVGVTVIAQELSLHKSTVSRLLATLEARGLVEHAAHRGGYRLGHGVVLLAEGASRKPDLTLTSRPVCVELAEEVGETVNVVVCESGRSVTVDQVLGAASVSTVNWVGQRQPLHSTAAGKVFLAAMPDDELSQHLSGRRERHTEHTIVTRDALLAELEQVRQNGYACAVEEAEIGLVAVAAGVRDLEGNAVAALSVSGPSFRLVCDILPRLGATVQAYAARISELNGSPRTG